jgi:hypothetical protein
MNIFKFLFSISGDEFWPDKILSRIKGEFVVASKNNVGDRKFHNNEDIYEFGSLSIWHPKKFCTDNSIADYEKWFVKFVEENYSLFMESGANEFEIYMEIYFDGGQCNFQIFDKDLLKKLTLFNIALPISIYTMDSSRHQRWISEIELAWEN